MDWDDIVFTWFITFVGIIIFGAVCIFPIVAFAKAGCIGMSIIWTLIVVSSISFTAWKAKLILFEDGKVKFNLPKK